MITVKDIIKKYLVDNGYDGLYHLEADCGCFLNDLFLCDEWCLDCKPGVQVDDGIGPRPQQ